MHNRYALYYMPEPGTSLAEFGDHWLGWSTARSAPCRHPALPGFSDEAIEAITRTPRKYGFHGTLKPPMRLAPGRDLDQLIAAAERLTATIPAFTLAPLQLSRIGGFLALTTGGNDGAMASLAATLVDALDDFRAAPGEAELARRRAAGLTPNQETLLQRWGYPYVMDEFHFHLTLTGRLDDQAIADLTPALDAALDGIIGAPLEIEAVVLAGEDGDGRFHAINRLPLKG